MRFAHVTFDFRLRHECRDGVDDDHVDRAGAHEYFADLERLFAGIRLRDEQVLHIDAKLFCVLGVERVFGIDEGGHSASFLRIGDHVQTECGLAAGFRTVDLGDAAARNTADTDCCVEIDGAGGNGLDPHLGVGSQSHDRAFAALLFDLCDGERQGLALVVVRC